MHVPCSGSCTIPERCIWGAVFEQVVCEATQCEDYHVRKAAYEAIWTIATLYYDKLQVILGTRACDHGCVMHRLREESRPKQYLELEQTVCLYVPILKFGDEVLQKALDALLIRQTCCANKPPRKT